MKILLFLLISLPAFALSPSGNGEDFCKDRENPQYVKELARNTGNLMSFRNYGGIGNGGVCWWHSRFQRNALYLTYYNPNAPIPTKEEAKKLIRNIRNANGVQEIKGFRNFYEFSSHFATEIQSELETWQRFEGKRGTFIRGLRGSAVVSADWLLELMNDLYEEVAVRNNIAYQKLQLKGVTAHAWLVINMTKAGSGYDLEILDSNFPHRTSFYQYRYGDTNLNYQDLGAFVPYLEFTNEIDWIRDSIKEFCP